MNIEISTLAKSYIEAREDLRSAYETYGHGDLNLKQDFCFAVADWYESARYSTGTSAEKEQYRYFKDETLMQYSAAVLSGVKISPWLQPGQPYRDFPNLRRSVEESGEVSVFLTSSGHGEADARPQGHTHEMVQDTSICISGVKFAYNDIFRAVHDLFGHVAPGNGFDAGGELRASWNHCHMYPRDCHPVLLSETVGQICWFYFGSHLRDGFGSIPAPGELNYVPARMRPYSPQKNAPMPADLVAEFYALFQAAD